MDPWDNINPYTSSSCSRYGNQVFNFETCNRTNADQTSRCIWGQADKPNPRIRNLPLSSAFQEREVSYHCSAQGQWEKTNKYVGGISCASTKNNLPLYTRREQRGRYWRQWRNEEVLPSDIYRKEESSYRFSGKNKNDKDYEAETKLHTRNYHSGGNHNNVSESKLKNTFRYDRLDRVGEMKSDYDNQPEIRLHERDRHDLRNCDYYSDKSDGDVDRLGSDYSSYKDNYVVRKKRDCEPETQLRRRDDSPYKSQLRKQNVDSDKTHKHSDWSPSLSERNGHYDSHLRNREQHLEEPNYSIASSYSYPNKSQLEMKDNADNRKHPEKKTLVSGGPALSASLIPQTSKVQAPPLPNNQSRRKRAHERVKVTLPSGRCLLMKRHVAVALGLIGKKYDKEDDSSDSSTNDMVPSDFEETFDYIKETGLRKRDLSPDREHVVEPQLRKQNVDSDKTHQHSEWNLTLGESHSDSHLRNDEQHLEEPNYSVASSHSYPNKSQLEMKDNADNRKQPEKKELVPGAPSLSPLLIPQTSKVQEPPLPKKQSLRKRAQHKVWMTLPSGERLRLRRHIAVALGQGDKKCDYASKIQSIRDNSSDSSTTVIFASGKSLQLKKSDAIALGLLHENYDCATNVHSKRDNSSDSSTNDIVPSDFEETFDYIAETGLRKRDLSSNREHVVEPQLKKQNVDSDKTHKHSDWNLSLGESSSDSHLKNHEQHLEKPNYSIANSDSYPNKSQLKMKDNSDNRKQPEKKELVPGAPSLSPLLIPQTSKVQEHPLPKEQSRRKRAHARVNVRLPSGRCLRMKRHVAVALGLTGKKYDKEDDSSDSSTNDVPSDFEETFDYIEETGLRKRDLSPDREHVVEPQLKKQNVDSDKTHKHSDWNLSLGESHSDSHLRNHEQHLEEPNYALASSHSYPNKSQLEMKDNADNRKQPEKKELVPGGPSLSTLLIPQTSKVQEHLLPKEQSLGKLARAKVRVRLPSGGCLRLKRHVAVALGYAGKKYDFTTKVQSVRDNSSDSSTTVIFSSGASLRLKKSDAIALGLLPENYDCATNVHSKRDNSSDSSTNDIVPSDFEETFDYIAETGLKKRDLSSNREHVVEPQLKKQNVDSDKTHKHSDWNLPLGESHSDSHLRNHEQHLEKPNYSIANSDSYPNKSQLKMKDNSDNRKQPEKKELVPGAPSLSPLLIPQTSKVQEHPVPKEQSLRKLARARVRVRLPSGGCLRLKRHVAAALGYAGKKYDFATKVQSVRDNSSDSSTTVIFSSGASLRLKKSDAIALGLLHENYDCATNVHSKRDNSSDTSTITTTT